MKANVYDLTGKKAGEVELPVLFGSEVRADVIKRAVLAQQSARRQPYGADPMAGKRTSAHYHGSRHYRYTMMNREMARMPRIHGKASGHLAWRARFAPQTVKGRCAHPPKSEKIWLQKINAKEKRLAIRSALAAAATDLVREKHRVGHSPVIFINDLENVRKTKDVINTLASLMPKELERCSAVKVRAGKGKMRGRKYKKRKGPLIVASKDCALIRAARNIAGVDAVSASNINAELLAPGAQAGRALVVTEAALGELQKKFGE